MLFKIQVFQDQQYKTIKKFEQANLVYIQQSQGDKREFNLILAN